LWLQQPIGGKYIKVYKGNTFIYPNEFIMIKFDKKNLIKKIKKGALNLLSKIKQITKEIQRCLYVYIIESIISYHKDRENVTQIYKENKNYFLKIYYYVTRIVYIYYLIFCAISFFSYLGDPANYDHVYVFGIYSHGIQVIFFGTIDTLIRISLHMRHSSKVYPFFQALGYLIDWFLRYVAPVWLLVHFWSTSHCLEPTWLSNMYNMYMPTGRGFGLRCRADYFFLEYFYNHIDNLKAVRKDCFFDWNNVVDKEGYLSPEKAVEYVKSTNSGHSNWVEIRLRGLLEHYRDYPAWSQLNTKEIENWFDPTTCEKLPKSFWEGFKELFFNNGFKKKR
jgi:hypothetical protein